VIGGWFMEKKRSSGGALIEIGGNALDSARYLMGTPRPISVSASVFQDFKSGANTNQRRRRLNFRFHPFSK
jgi:predicted dehydrogenase